MTTCIRMIKPFFNYPLVINDKTLFIFKTRRNTTITFKLLSDHYVTWFLSIKPSCPTSARLCTKIPTIFWKLTKEILLKIKLYLSQDVYSISKADVWYWLNDYYSDNITVIGYIETYKLNRKFSSLIERYRISLF